MLKKLLIAFCSVIAFIAVLIIVAGIIVSSKVNKDFVSSKMSAALSRQVTIEKMDVSIFSVLSGIELKKVAVSNFKTINDLKNLQGKPIAPGDVFADIESLKFRVKLLPLLKKQVELKELVMYGPVVNLSKNKQGKLNIDDLLKSKKQPVDIQQKEQEPLSADNIPVAIAVGEIGMKDGTINYYDMETDQRFQIYKLTTIAHDIKIDPANLEKKNEIKINFGMGIKTVGEMKTGSVKSFDVTIDVTGKMIPFDIKTRLLNPEAIVHVAVPDGEITGLQIFNSIASIPILGDYLGEYISFLKDRQQWKNSREAGMDLHYKADRLDITNGKLNLKEAGLTFDGSTNIKTKAVDMNMGVVLKKDINNAVKTSLAARIDSLIKSPEIKKYVDSQKLAEGATQPLLNKDGQIDLKIKVNGTMQKPDVKLTKPQMSLLGDVIKSAAGNAAVEAGKGAAKETAKKILNGNNKNILDGVGELFKKK